MKQIKKTIKSLLQFALNTLFIKFKEHKNKMRWAKEEKEQRNNLSRMYEYATMNKQHI